MKEEASVILINTPAKKNLDQYDTADFPNPSIAYLAAYLLKNNISCKVIDSKLSRLTEASVLESLEREKAALVGITSMTHEIAAAAELAAAIKARFPEKKIVIGGPHATALPEETLREFSAFDFLVHGEGEKPLASLANCLAQGKACDNIKGLLYLVNGRAAGERDEDPVEDINDIPSPAYGLFPKSRRYYILTTRGCFHRCPFCYNKKGKLRFRSVNSVIEELKSLVNNYQPKVITITDDTFNADKKRTYEILDSLIKEGLNKEAEFKATLHASNLDYPLLCRMKEAGFRIIHLGIESGNEKILAEIGKGINKDLIRRVNRDAKKAGIAVQGLYIIGHPDETWKTAFDTVKFAVKLNTHEIALAVMVPYPGTKIWEYAKENRRGYRSLSGEWKKYSKYFGPAVELENLNKMQLLLLQVMAYAGLYLYNLRPVSFVKFMFSYRCEISSYGVSLLQKIISFPLTYLRKCVIFKNL